LLGKGGIGVGFQNGFGAGLRKGDGPGGGAPDGFPENKDGGIEFGPLY
jgi:hypothetical protein